MEDIETLFFYVAKIMSDLFSKADVLHPTGSVSVSLSINPVQVLIIIKNFTDYN